MAKLHDYYRDQVVNELKNKFGYKSVMQVPRIEKITLNMGVGEAVADKKDSEFGRSTAMDHDLTTGPFHAIQIAPGIHHTMGGLKINTNAQVLKEDGSVINGLYAAGEVTGGVHGANRIGGNAVADIIISGRQAGAQAAREMRPGRGRPLPCAL